MSKNPYEFFMESDYRLTSYVKSTTSYELALHFISGYIDAVYISNRDITYEIAVNIVAMHFKPEHIHNFSLSGKQYKIYRDVLAYFGVSI